MSSFSPLPLTFILIVVVHAVSLAVGVGGLAVVDVVAVQVGELGEELEDGFPVVGQVGHLAVEQVQTLQLWQFFLAKQRRVRIATHPCDLPITRLSCDQGRSNVIFVH